MKRIQDALMAILGVDLSSECGTFRTLTAQAVLQYKESKTPPIRQPWQTGPDDPIVGKRTIKALDRDMLALQNRRPLPPPTPNLKFDALIYFSSFVDPGGAEITNARSDDGSLMLAPMRAMTFDRGTRRSYERYSLPSSD